MFPVIDPLKIIGKFSNIISLIFRFWGNLFASSILVGLLFFVVNSRFTGTGFEFLGASISSFILFPVHFYFDLMDGAIQPLIFMLLTMSYWKVEGQIEVDPNFSSEQVVVSQNYLTNIA